MLNNLVTFGSEARWALTRDTVGTFWSLEAVSSSSSASIRFEAKGHTQTDNSPRWSAAGNSGDVFDSFSENDRTTWYNDGQVTFTITDLSDNDIFTFSIEFVTTPPVLQIDCAQFNLPQTITPNSEGDAGDSVRICTPVNRESDATTGIDGTMLVVNELNGIVPSSVTNIQVKDQDGNALDSTQLLRAEIVNDRLEIEAKLFTGLIANAKASDACYVVADNGVIDENGKLAPLTNPPSSDYIQTVNLTTGEVRDVGPLGTKSVEAIALDWSDEVGGERMFAVDHISVDGGTDYAVLGYIDLVPDRNKKHFKVIIDSLIGVE